MRLSVLHWMASGCVFANSHRKSNVVWLLSRRKYHIALERHWRKVRSRGDVPTSSDRIADTLMNGKVSTIPVGEINGQPVLFVVGIGFDAEAVRQFETAGTRKIGQAGFVMPVLNALLSESRSLKVTTDHGSSEAQWVIVPRTQHCAANFFSAECRRHSISFHVVRFSDDAHSFDCGSCGACRGTSRF